MEDSREGTDFPREGGTNFIQPRVHGQYARSGSSGDTSLLSRRQGWFRWLRDAGESGAVVCALNRHLSEQPTTVVSKKAIEYTRINNGNVTVGICEWIGPERFPRREDPHV